MDMSFSNGEKIRKFGISARKALRERLDPTSESSTRIAEASDPSMSPNPEATGDSTPTSIRDGVLRGGRKRDEMSDEERHSRKKARHIKKKLTYSSGERSPQVLVRDGSTVAYEARIAGHRRVKQVTKWKSLDPDTVRKFLKANPGFIDKHRGQVGNYKPERIKLMGELKAAEINSGCFKGGSIDKAPVLAHNSPDLVSFCEAVRNHLETVDCAKHISTDGSPVLCELIDEGCYRNDQECLILAQSINISNRLLFIRKDKYVFAILKGAGEKKPLFAKRVRDMKWSITAVMQIWQILTEYIEVNKVIHGVEFSKKWKLLTMNHGEPVRNFFSRIDALCAEKVTKLQREVPIEDIIALVVACLPQNLLDRILKEEEMIEKGWEETKKEIVREAERKRKDEPSQRPFYREHRRMEANFAEPTPGNCFVCKEPGHRKRDCPVFRASLIDKGVNVDEYMAEYDQKHAARSAERNDRATSSQPRNANGAGRGYNGSGRGNNGAGRGADPGRGGGRGKAGASHYGPSKSTPQAHAVSVSCLKCCQKGHLATVCPFNFKQEQAYSVEVIDPSKIVLANNGEINEEYSCFVCDVQGVVRNVIIFDSGCSRHMFSDYKMFKNLSMDVDLWVKCANGSLTKVLGVGDVGSLRNVLLVPQLKKDLISEGQLAREMDWTIIAKKNTKRVFNEAGDLIMEGFMNESNLYVVSPKYFITEEDANQANVITRSGDGSSVFAGMADLEEESEEAQLERYRVEMWYRLHALQVHPGNDPIGQVRRLAWSNWRTYYDDEEQQVPEVIDELWWYMTDEEYLAIAPHGQSRSEEINSELAADYRPRPRRFIPVEVASQIAENWLIEYGRRRAEMGYYEDSHLLSQLRRREYSLSARIDYEHFRESLATRGINIPQRSNWWHGRDGTVDSRWEASRAARRSLQEQLPPFHGHWAAEFSGITATSTGFTASRTTTSTATSNPRIPIPTFSRAYNSTLQSNGGDPRRVEGSGTWSRWPEACLGMATTYTSWPQVYSTGTSTSKMVRTRDHRSSSRNPGFLRTSATSSTSRRTGGVMLPFNSYGNNSTLPEGITSPRAVPSSRPSEESRQSTSSSTTSSSAAVPAPQLGTKRTATEAGWGTTTDDNMSGWPDRGDNDAEVKEEKGKKPRTESK